LRKVLVRLFRFVQLRVECVRDRRVNVPWLIFDKYNFIASLPKQKMANISRLVFSFSDNE